MKFAGLIALALVSWNASAQSHCPDQLTGAQLEQLRTDDDELLGTYALMRWFKCGWPEALPAMKVWRAAAAQTALEDAAEEGDAPAESNEFVDDLRTMLWMNPTAFDKQLADDFSDEPNEDDPVPVAALMQLRVPPALMLRHLDLGRSAAAAFLREDLSLPAATELIVELSVVAQEIRFGKIDEARAHFDRVERNWMARAAQQADEAYATPDSDAEATERLESMRAVLAPVGPMSGATTATRWIVNRSTGRRSFCGTGAMMEKLFSTTYLRDAVLRAADADSAIAEALPGDWRAQVGGGGVRTGLLVELLRKRYGKAELKQGWDDALAGLRTDGASTGIVLFGHYLALPDAVVEGDANSPETTQRPFRPDELVELVKATALYRASHAE